MDFLPAILPHYWTKYSLNGLCKYFYPSIQTGWTPAPKFSSDAVTDGTIHMSKEYKGGYHAYNETPWKEQVKFPSSSENDLREKGKETGFGSNGSYEVGMGWGDDSCPRFGA